MNLLSYRTNTTLPRLFFDKFGLKSLLQILKLTSTGLSSAYIESVEPSVCFENIGLKHFVEELWIFRIKFGRLNGVEDGGLLIDLSILEEFFFGDLYPVGVKDEEALFDCVGHITIMKLLRLIANL